MSKDSSFERSLDRLIRRRNWTEVSGLWLNNIPEIFPPGAAPESSLGELIILPGIGEIFPGGDNMVYGEVPALRKALLRESIYLLHKCAHVVSVAELTAKRGQLTWSLSDGYHGALFGARAICGFLGIGTLERDNQAVIFNLWPVRPEHENKRTRINDAASETLFFRPGFKLEHRHNWAILMRLLRTFTVPLWPSGLVNKLKTMDARGFTHQRNKIHYESHSWLGADLHAWSEDGGFGIRSLMDELSLDEEGPDFSLSLGLVLLHLGRLLLDGLKTRILDYERELFDKKSGEGWHPLLNRAFGGQP